MWITKKSEDLMKLPLQTQYLIEQALELVRHDPQHKLGPLQRIPIYESFNSEENGYGDTAFLRLQLITAYHILPIWKEAQADNPLAEDLLKMAKQILQKEVDKEIFTDRLQEIWVDLEIAEINSTYSEKAFAAVSAAFETLHIILKGFDNWKEWKFCDDDTDDDLGMWGNDSASWASNAWAGWIMDMDAAHSQKRLEFWEWWLTEAIPQAWEF
jgi:hypothetical protein